MRWLLLPAVLVAHLCAADLETGAREIIARRCLNCHSAQTKAGRLDLTSRETALRGGARGPALQPGQPRRSLLLSRIEQRQMPPAAPLPPTEAETLRQWIAAGAPWTHAIQERRAGPGWWSLQPLAPQPGRHSIDGWIHVKLQEIGRAHV